MNYVNAFVYDPATGKILRRQSCAYGEVDYLGPNVVAVDQATSEGWTDVSHWVDGGELVLRPLMEPAPSSLSVFSGESVTITGLPDAGIMHIGASEQIAWTGGVITFSPNTPGIYQLRFESFPYTDAMLEITVT
jgi:hypothetical protein